jgi:hypothetical protein
MSGSATQPHPSPLVDLPTTNSRLWAVGLTGFAVLAAVVLAISLGALGWRVLILVVVFHLGVVILARRTGDPLIWRAWAVLAPMSLLMVLPDWYLSAELGTLVFPDTGAPYIGTVPLFMAGMWTIALMPIVWVTTLVARRVGVAVGVGVAAVVGLVFFWAAELVAPSIPLWEPVGVVMFAGVALYVLLPEMVLSAAAFALVVTVGRIPALATAALLVLLPFTYTGMLVTSHQFLG